MNEPEARLFKYLSQFRRLDELVLGFGTLARRKESSENRWVVGQGFKPASERRMTEPNYEQQYSDVIATTSYLPIGAIPGPG